MKNKNVYEPLRTPYEEKMDTACPFSDYPRPQLRRDSYFSLCGKWDFRFEKETEFKKEILVPFPPESRLSGLDCEIPKKQVLVYRRKFTLPKDFVKSSVILHFGAVDQICDVEINGFHVAHHEGGYIPFSIDITKRLFKGENTITVFAKDTLNRKYPYGKQTKKRGGMWYTEVSGIWQPVWIESLPEKPILSLKIDQNAKFAKITVNSGAEFKKLTLKDTEEVFEFTGDSIIIEPRQPKLWTPETPFLYEFSIETESDRIESYFALREISVAEIDGVKRLTLNGEPYLFSGLLDQGYYPDGIFLPATADAYAEDILLAKRLGFNTLRKHIKIEPMIFYYLCDKLGMVVFQDMVNNSGYSFILDTALPTVGFKKYLPTLRHGNKDVQECFLNQMKETVELLYNSPSVCLYTVFNEGWGEFDPDRVYEQIKVLDATRIIDATSGWFFGKKSDVNSQHVYFRTPKVKKCPDAPLHLSEFGGYSLRIDGHLFGEKNYGYSIYSDKESFTEAVVKLYSDIAKNLIDKGLSALIYTQLSDVEDETNGLITYDRRVVKIDEARMLEANQALYSAFADACSKK